ncbi:hypothetical protein EN45_067480 [Penicillium chrysogenum]|uniref:Protein kinase domain-containing protein n=1 Tax=Penicillium chrysogenum TaxID=5076 RepID=A0A167TE61_PENCH|nr:hypothetical protein EN45_067480 [Penicillium chrysogenum]
MENTDSRLRNVRLCPTLKLGDQTITVTDVKRLDQNRPVYRLEIEPGYFDGIRALVFSEVVGTTLLDLARSKKPIDEKTMKDKLIGVFQSLSARGAIYWDQKLDNFMYCDNGAPDASKVMVVDFEQVEFPTLFRPWKLGVNNEGARALMDDFRDTRDRYYETSPVRPWEHEPDSRDEEYPLRTIDSNVITPSMGSGSIEALRYIAA